ncbi:uncharacterized protein LOC131077922 isoform X1 [Cryptomeria japonica]|uniref:uncharacterized protein LOC131077922 isoform X1 n=1 Tax=Cryptomeria japonica TaxID=3369 RepID=UPI0027DA84E6|nr:uncharacterized protein LOC131077922 isoform X1 [Cryptomeria japonica]XP_059067932.1 uncharacterized protein LOC131077922 isoform X1 [Cryptomeria japonica]
MEEKSIGLGIGPDVPVYNKAPFKEGIYSIPMAGDPAFPPQDMGSSMGNSSRFNESQRYRPVDLSVRTGEEFAMAFSPLSGGGWTENNPGGYWMFGGRKSQIPEGEGTHGYAYEGGMMGMGGQMISGNNISDVAERGNFTAEYGGDYHGVNNENPRAAQGFGLGVDDEFPFDDGSVPQSEFLHRSASAATDDAGGSQKVKFMCSFGGKILPRPSDGALRYVGGETRIVTVGRGIGYSELMQKMVEVCGLVVLLKYQLPNEDLDALVSVSCDEDIENMMDEYERLLEGSGEGSPRLRLFLFTASDSDLAHLASMNDHKLSKQRYVDAVNGITEIGFRKNEDSLASASSQNLENLIGLDSGNNLNSMLPDQGVASGPLPIKIMPQDVVNSGPLPTSSPVSSKQGTSKVPILTPSTSSSSVLSSVPTHPNQSGLGDSSGLFIPEQQGNVAGHSYSVFQQLDRGAGYHDTDYRRPVPSVTTFQSDPQIKAAGSRREWQQENFDVSQSMLDTRSDTLLPPLDPHPTVAQHPTPSTYWQHHVDSYPQNFRYIQQANVEGGPARQLFQQHSLQEAHQNNPWQVMHDGRVYMNAAQEQQQQQSDLFGGSYSDKPASAHIQAHMASTTGSLQPISGSQSSHLIGHQNSLGQQHLQMHRPPNVKLMEQPSYGPRLHYYDHNSRAVHPMSLPSQYQRQGYEQFARQQDLCQDHLFHSEENIMPQHIVPTVHSDGALQNLVTKPVHAMYEGISQGHHTNGSVRQPPSNVRENFVQESVISAGDHQDMTDRRRLQPMISRQQGYTIPHGGMEYVVKQSSSPYIHERQDEGNYVLQHRMQEPDFDAASSGRMAKSEAKQDENGTDLSGRHLTEPGTTSSGIFLPEDPYGLSRSGLGDSRHTYQQSDNFGSFEPTSYQFKQAPTAGDMKAVGILPDPVQATRRTAIMNEVAVPSSGINIQEVRVVNPLQESMLVDQLPSTSSLLPGVDQSIEQRLRDVNLSSYLPNTEGEPSISSETTSMWWNGNGGDDCVKVDMLHNVHKQSVELGEVKLQDGSPLVSKSEISEPGDISVSAVHNESSSNLICMAEQPQEQLLGEMATADASGHLSFTLPDDISNARSSNKNKEFFSNSEPITLPESSQYGIQVPAKEIVDDDSGHAVRDIHSNRSSFDRVKDGDVTSPVGKSEYDSTMDLLKDVSASYVGTGKVTEPSSCTKTISSSNLSPISNNSVSTSFLVQDKVTYREEVSVKDGFGLGLSSQALPLSDIKVEAIADKHGEGEGQNAFKDLPDLPAASVQLPLCNAPTLSMHEWDQATEGGNVQGNTSQRDPLKGAEDEMVTISDSITEDHIAIESGMDEPDIVIKEAINLGLQTIKYADLEELRELGSGTFGTVYHGKWRGTDVAIKRIKNSCFMGKPSEQERLRADFWREAHMLAQLHHPNVVAFYGVVPDGPGGTLATVTEYMVNGSLKQVLQRKDRYRGIDLRKRLIISMDAAFGMEYLHGKNIVHFDLKCENLLVNMRDPQRPICKVGDLGLSKIKHQTLVSGGVRGTLPWMAPELLNGSSNMVSEKVDVFSFGIVMWELLTGEEPYANMHYGAIIGGIVNNTLRPPIPGSCDPAWRSLMERCWSADPSARPNFTEITSGLRSMATSLRSKGQGHQAHVPVHPQN